MGILLFSGTETGSEKETDATGRGSAEPVNTYARTGNFSIRLPDKGIRVSLTKPNDAVHNDDEALDVVTAYFRGYLFIESLPPEQISLPGDKIGAGLIVFGTGTIDSDTDWVFGVALTPEGRLESYNGDTFDLLNTSDYALKINTVYRVEVRLTLVGGGDDTYEIRVNDETWITGSSALTTHLKINVIELFNGDGLVQDEMSIVWDDIMIRDDTWCGPGRVYALRPIRAGNYSEWSDSLGAEDVRKPYALSKTTWVSDSAAANARLSFKLDRVRTAEIKGKIVGVAFYAWVANGGSATGNLFIRSGGVDHDFFTATIPGTTAGADTLGRLASITTVDPTDSNPWTRAKLDDLEIGVRHVLNGSIHWYSAFVVIATETLD